MFATKLATAVRAGNVSQAVLDDKVYRVLLSVSPTWHLYPADARSFELTKRFEGLGTWATVDPRPQNTHLTPADGSRFERFGT